jgi:hypothetical protein
MQCVFPQVALGALISYYLVKVVPYWGLALIGTTIVFVAPLIYKTNQELIDYHLSQASHVVSEQTAQLRAIAQKQTEQATHLTKQYVGDYSAKAQALIRGSPPAKSELKAEDFPAAPQAEFHHDDIKHEEQEPLIAS